MKIKELALKTADKYRQKKRPLNVERQIKRYWETKDPEKRKIIYQYICLERIIADYWKLFR